MSSQIRRVLIADDHHVVRRGIRALLEMSPSLEIVAEASTGRMALDAARETQPDIAIIDYAMPDLNGLELMIALQREVPRVDVLIFTMHDREDLILDVLRAGARGYVLKTDPERNLLAAMEALSLHRPYFSSGVSEALLERCIAATYIKPSALTQREREVVQLIAEGKYNKGIAHILDISAKTTETHRAAVMHKLKLRTTAELVRYAVRNNIVEV